jgi:hypothetical protein
MAIWSCPVVGNITTSWPPFWVEIKAKPSAVLTVQETRFGFISVGSILLAADVQPAVNNATVVVGSGIVRIKPYDLTELTYG